MGGGGGGGRGGCGKRRGEGRGVGGGKGVDGHSCTSYVTVQLFVQGIMQNLTSDE